MKINKIVFSLLIGIALLTSSCSDFLDQDPESKLPNTTVFSNPKLTNAHLLGIYGIWRDGHKGRADLFYGTDEGIVGGIQRENSERRGLDEYSDGMNSTNGQIRGIWTNRYQIISRSAEAISILKKNVSLGDPDLIRYLGEYCFLRAQSLWELTMLFGAVPVYDDDKPEYGGFRQPVDVVYANIVEDLLLAEQYLPDPKDVTDLGRVSKSLAQAYLGKVYLYAPETSGYRDYAKAAEYFKKVYENPYFGGIGSSNFKTIFDAYSENTADYRKEMVYAFQYNVGWPNNCGTEWEVGSRAVANMTPDIGEAMAPWSGFDAWLPTEYAYKMQKDGGVWEEGDVRRDESVRIDFRWKNYEPNLLGYGWGDELEPHIKKYEDPRTVDKGQNTWHSGKSIPFIRFSDVVLNYAECLYMTGKQGEAINMINNVVRTRAFGGALPADKKWSAGMGKEDFIKNLMDERIRELCFEGWRKYDLLRTGLLIEYAEKRNRWLIGGTWVNSFGDKKDAGAPNKKIQPYKLLWPIPLDELRQNPDLTLEDQNPGYNS